MMLWLILVLVFNFFSVNCDRRKVEVMDGHGYSLAIKRVECTNSSIVAVYVCKLKLMRGKIGAVSLGMTILERVPVVLFRIHVQRKTSANYYVPTVIDATFNVCEISQNAIAMGVFKKMITMFMPTAMELMQPFIHRCPFEGKHEVLNFVIERMTVPNVLQTGDAKIIGTVMDGKKTLLFELQAYVYIKSPSLMQIN